MRLVQTKQLEGNGIPYKSVQTICFEGDSFVRGITFSNRLRHLADDIYRAEVEAGNSCLIVEDETHFTIWLQEPTLAPLPANQAETAPIPYTVQQFVQHFADVMRVKLQQSTLMSEAISRKQPPAGRPRMMTSNNQPGGKASQDSKNANQPANRTAESSATLSQTIWPQLTDSALARASEISARSNSSQRFSAGGSAPSNELASDSFLSISPRLPTRGTMISGRGSLP